MKKALLAKKLVTPYKVIENAILVYEDGIIIAVGKQSNIPVPADAEVVDYGDKTLAPGCIDIHMHVESTMMTPENFGKAAILCGTTSVFVDPHEIGNVLGIPAVRFMIDNAKPSPVRQFNLAPSCLPSVPGAEGTGAEFEAEEIAEILEMEGIYGIAEMMDFVNMIHDSKKMHDIAEEGLKRNVLIQGHAPSLGGGSIAAYHMAGPVDNHSVRSAYEVIENLHAGMYVHLQASSLSKSAMPEMIRGLAGMRYTDHVCLCNDDVHAKDLIETGHVNRIIKAVLAEGVDPMDAYRWGTLNSARSGQMDDIGAIAPGYVADMQLLDELDGRDPYAVFRDGKLVAEGGKLVDEQPSQPIPEQVLGGTVRVVGLINAEDMALRAPEGCGDTVKTAVLTFDNGIRSEVVYEELPVVDGFVDISGDKDLCYLAVWNRHGDDSHTTLVARGLNVVDGALATTVSHDCHNLTVCYTTVEDGFAAAKALMECGGGFATAQNGEVTSVLALPVAGLMSTLPCRELVVEIARQQEAVDKVFSVPGNLMRMSTVSLACIPFPVITDQGLYDGKTQTFIEQFV